MKFLFTRKNIIDGNKYDRGSNGRKVSALLPGDDNSCEHSIDDN